MGRPAASRADPAVRTAFEAALSGDLPAGLDGLIAAFKRETAAEAPKIATRAASGNVLDVLVPAIPELIGGSADLTGSNNTRSKTGTDIATGSFDGRYIRYGVREHGMAAMMNGMALHGGLIPYGGTFLTFADYCRPSIRLAALMRQRVVFVMTHDSISASARTGRPTSRSSMSPACGRSRTCWCSARPIRSRPRNAGRRPWRRGRRRRSSR